MILVGTPLHAVSLPGFRRVVEHWHRQGRDDIRLVAVANGPDRERVRAEADALLRGYPRLRGHVLAVETADGQTDLLAAQRAIVAEALADGHTHLLWHEASRVPGRGAFRYLLAADKLVAGALYKDTYQVGYYCVWDFDPTACRHDPRPYLRIDEITGPTPVGAIGFGFTLVAAELLRRFELRAAPGCAADTLFCADLQDHGIPVHACPVYAKNTKIDFDPAALARWRTRRRLLKAHTTTKRGVPRLWEAVKDRLGVGM